MRDEDLWYCKSAGFNVTLAYRAHDAHNVLKDDTEKSLVCGERIDTGDPIPAGGTRG